jgi:hypothetical protein
MKQAICQYGTISQSGPQPPPANGVRRVAFLMLAYGARKRERASASPGGPKPCLLCKLKAHQGFPRGKRNRAGGKLGWAPGNSMSRWASPRYPNAVRPNLVRTLLAVQDERRPIFPLVGRPADEQVEVRAEVSELKNQSGVMPRCSSFQPLPLLRANQLTYYMRRG